MTMEDISLIFYYLECYIYMYALCPQIIYILNLLIRMFNVPKVMEKGLKYNLWKK